MFGGQNNYVAPVAPAIVPTNNLILYLNANSYAGNGVAWNDNSTQNNNATLVGSPNIVPILPALPLPPINTGYPQF